MNKSADYVVSMVISKHSNGSYVVYWKRQTEDDSTEDIGFQQFQDLKALKDFKKAVEEGFKTAGI